MTEIILARDRVREFYSQYEIYLTPVLRFLLAFITYTLINTNIGTFEPINNIVVVFMTSLANAFMPSNAILLFTAAFIVLHLYKVSLECAAIVLIVFLVLFLVYFHFSPKDSLGVLLTPLAFILKVPFAVPISAGLAGNIFSCISVSCGVFVYYVVRFAKENTFSFNGDIEAAATDLREFLNTMLGNKTMLSYMLTFSATIIIVYLIRRLSIDYSWIIAIVVGAIVEILTMLLLGPMLGADINLGGLFIGTLVGVLLSFVLNFMLFSVDYSKTEYLQFEDEEYYYYVKAVPKIKEGYEDEVEVESPKNRHHSSKSATSKKHSRMSDEYDDEDEVWDDYPETQAGESGSRK